MPAGRRKHCVSRGDVPFHGAAQARIQIGFAGGDAAQLE